MLDGMAGFRRGECSGCKISACPFKDEGSRVRGGGERAVCKKRRETDIKDRDG